MAGGQSVLGVVLPARPTGRQPDGGLAGAIAATAWRLLVRNGTVLVNEADGFRDLDPSDVMVIATHHDQLAQLAPLLPDDVRLGTADSLQGEDAPIVLAWHPLSVLPNPTRFTATPGGPA